MATEIIDLLSSEDDGAIKAVSKSTSSSAFPKSGAPKVRRETPSTSAHDFDLELSPERLNRTKRRKISPVDDPISSSLPAAQQASHPGPQSRQPVLGSRKKLPDDPLELDPIVFTSSPRGGDKKNAGSRKPKRTTSPPSPGDGRSKNHANDFNSSQGSDQSLQEVSTNVRSIAVSKSKAKGVPVSAELKENEKLERAAAREAEKERKQQDRARLKEEAVAKRKIEREEKAREKQREKDLADANKARHDKKVSAAEMIVDLPSSVQGKSVDTQVREMLRRLDIDVSSYTSLLPNIVKWRRKVQVRFDDELGHWIPTPPKVEQEPHVLCYIEATNFIGMVDKEAPEDEGLEAHVQMVKRKFAGAKIIYLLEGLEVWLKKSRNAKNREYQAAVRGEKAGKKKSDDTPNADEETVEDALLRLQVIHECLIHHTVTAYESAEWIVHFTQHISTIPYRNVKDNISTSFCMDIGQIRTGDDAHDTYVKMLQQIVRVTPPIAYGVAREYPNVESLVTAFENEGGNILEDLRKGSNRDGGLSEARIGPAISKRLEKVFLGRDPTSQDV